ncbi:MAG: hypothetical protein PHU85_12890 [Phycisphaerae bacterium]|nr:hypothetical protein [Phycisphaerae bacterium]
MTPPRSATWIIHGDDRLYDAFCRMGEDDIGRLVVVDRSRRVVGLTSRLDVMSFPQIHAGLNPAAVNRSVPLCEMACSNVVTCACGDS